MNIEQIAFEVAQDMGQAAYDSTPQESLPEFLRRCLSKLAEQDVEPIAWMHRNAQGVLLITERKPSWDESIWPPVFTETQLLAAQQRTAEACAKVCEARYDKACFDMGDYPDGYDLSEAIRNGGWREYL